MVDSVSLRVDQQQNQQQIQRLMMMPQMQQALHILQMPIMELQPLIEACLAENPLVSDETEEEIEDEEEIEEDDEEPSEKELRFSDEDLSIFQHLDRELHDHFSESGEYRKTRSEEEKEKKQFLEESIITESSLFEYLMQQARETFHSAEELSIAEILIGNFDEHGFLKSSWEELLFLYQKPEERLKKVLKTIQTFEPYGIGASSLQESLIIQLRCRNKQETLAYAILEKSYEALLHNNLPLIQKNLRCSIEEIHEAIQQIAHLDLHPGSTYSRQMVQTIVPDATLRHEDGKLLVIINDEYIPNFRINSRYLKMLEDPATSPDTKTFIKNKFASLKWLYRNLHQRNSTLERISSFLAKEQYNFLTDPHGKLIPMKMQAVAKALEVHESTITRAISNKYLDTPRGIIPFKAFFTYTYSNSEEELSSNTVKETLRTLIQEEDKRYPYSDAQLSSILKEKGIDCARRTVAKYRQALNQGNAQQRRKFTGYTERDSKIGIWAAPKPRGRSHCK